MIFPLEQNSPIEWLSLDDYVAQQSDSILYVRVRGESMNDVGINAGDLAVVDRLKTPTIGAVVLVKVGNHYAIKKYQEIDSLERRRNFYLVSSQGVEVQTIGAIETVGVITFLVKNLGGGK